MKFDYLWWDLEDSEFKGELYNTIGCFYLYDHPYQTWEEFQEALPHMAYTHLISVRFHRLEQLFIDLRVVPQMLGVAELPIKSEVMDINRYDWLKLIVELTLMRFSSIRDTSFHFVNELLELNLNDFKLNYKNLQNRLNQSHPYIIAVLKKINETGVVTRKERNLRAHNGSIDLKTDDDQMFKNASWLEIHGFTSTTHDINAVYQDAAQKIYERLIVDTEELLKQVIELVDALIPEFQKRYDEKRCEKFNDEDEDIVDVDREIIPNDAFAADFEKGAEEK